MIKQDTFNTCWALSFIACYALYIARPSANSSFSLTIVEDWGVWSYIYLMHSNLYFIWHRLALSLYHSEARPDFKKKKKKKKKKKENLFFWPICITLHLEVLNLSFHFRDQTFSLSRSLGLGLPKECVYQYLCLFLHRFLCHQQII